MPRKPRVALPAMPTDATTAALLVLVRTPHIRAYLQEHDPKALEQATDALQGITPPPEPEPALVGYGMTVRIIGNHGGNPPGKLADAELHFSAGPFAGCKLIGFAVWERRTGGGRNVTFPARQYSVNGERRTFALLRPIADTNAQEHVRQLVLEGYAAYEAGGSEAAAS